MDQIDLDMNDLFGDGVDLEEEIAGQHHTERDREDEGEDDGGRGNEDEAEEVDMETLQRLKRLSQGAAKRVIKNPQQKLDATRLIGDKGLKELLETFQKTKFKGKGFELEDLSTMMKKLEHWAHRLFPKMTFDEIIDRLEWLGKRREVKTIINKLRLGLGIGPLSDEIVRQHDDSDEENKENDAEQDQLNNTEDIADIDPFDEIVRQTQPTSSTPFRPSKPMRPVTSAVSFSMGEDEGDSFRQSDAFATSSQTTNQEDIQAKIARNREQAMARLQAKRRLSGAVSGAGSPSLRHALNVSRGQLNISEVSTETFDYSRPQLNHQSESDANVIIVQSESEENLITNQSESESNVINAQSDSEANLITDQPESEANITTGQSEANSQSESANVLAKSDNNVPINQSEITTGLNQTQSESTIVIESTTIDESESEPLSNPIIQGTQDSYNLTEHELMDTS